MRRQKELELLELIRALHLPVSASEAQEYINGFDDEEIDLLITLCKEKKDYNDLIDKLAYDANPEKAKQIDQDF